MESVRVCGMPAWLLRISACRVLSDSDVSTWLLTSSSADESENLSWSSHGAVPGKCQSLPFGLPKGCWDQHSAEGSWCFFSWQNLRICPSWNSFSFPIYYFVWILTYWKLLISGLEIFGCRIFWTAEICWCYWHSLWTCTTLYTDASVTESVSFQIGPWPQIIP